jgi:2-dehydropantoate 2-reductase
VGRWRDTDACAVREAIDAKEGTCVMRVLVFGAGAVGMWMGAALGRKGHEVSLVARPLHVAAIRDQGIRVASALGEHVVTGPVAVESALDLAGPFDLVIVAVKAFDTRAAMNELARLLDRRTVVLSIQDGLGNLELIAPFVDRERLLGATVFTGIEVEGPGAVRVVTPGGTVRIGAHERSQETYELAARVSEVLAAAGITTRPTDDIHHELWMKLLITAVVNPLTALHGVCVADLPDRDGVVRIMDAIAREIFDVADAASVELPWLHHEDFTRYMRSAILPRIGAHRPPMLQDLRSGRRTEIDSMNGYVTALGRRFGVRTPVNAWITDLVKQKARRFEGAAA